MDLTIAPGLNSRTSLSSAVWENSWLDAMDRITIPKEKKGRWAHPGWVGYKLFQPIQERKDESSSVVGKKRCLSEIIVYLHLPLL